VATPITEAGAAPVLLDHVVKNREGRGKYAIGSERKASGAIVHVGFKLHTPLSRGGTGKARLVTHKDRPGFLPRPNIGTLVLDSDGEHITYRLEADHSHDGDRFRPTGYMEKVSLRLEGEGEPVSQRWVLKNVTGKDDYVKDALGVLVDEGFVVKETSGSAHRFTSIRPYREATDDYDNTSDGSASRRFAPTPRTSASLRPLL